MRPNDNGPRDRMRRERDGHWHIHTADGHDIDVGTDSKAAMQQFLHSAQNCVNRRGKLTP